jgi:DNA-binding NtrC family response regulator
MPDLTGFELAREILKIKPEMPIILCTGYSAVVSEEEALAIGIRKYLFKPVDTVTLAQVVRQTLNEG